MNQAGLAECIVRAAQACHPYIQPVLYQSIILTGGSTLFPRFAERFARTTADGELGAKMDEGDREKVREAAREASEWLEANPEADKDDYAEKLKELEDVCSPAFAAAYGNAGGGHDAAAEEDNDHDEL